MGAVRDARTLRSSSADSAFGAALQPLSGELYKGETLWIVAVEEAASRSSKVEPPASPQRSSLPLQWQRSQPEARRLRRPGAEDFRTSMRRTPGIGTGRVGAASQPVSVSVSFIPVHGGSPAAVGRASVLPGTLADGGGR